MKILLVFSCIAMLAIACTKSVGLYTEVEFEVSEQYLADGFVNTPLSVNLTVIPEEIIADVGYTYRLESFDGQGVLMDSEGNTLNSGDKIGFDALSAALEFIGTEEGSHTIAITVEDSYGFTKEVRLVFNITDIPLLWRAESPITQMELGTTVDINLILENQTDAINGTFECNYQQSLGDGTLTGFPTADAEFPTEFTTIVPGNFALEFTPDVLGNIELIFRLRDSNGQELTSSVTIEVVEEIIDMEPPVLSISGTNPTQVFIGQPYMDEGATAMDNVDGNITDQITTVSNVDTSVEDSYQVIYSVADTDGNSTSATRVVNVVQDPNGSEIAVTGISITEESLSLTEGATGALMAVINPTNATNQGIDWVSNNPAVATVDASGTVTAIAQGNAIITATSQENNTLFDTAAISVTTETVNVTGIDITQTGLSLIEGDTGTLTAVISPSNATNQGVDWVSNNPAVATVNASGTVTAVTQGNAIITATSQENNTLFDTAAISVTMETVDVTGIDITQADLSLVEGNTGTLTAVISPTNATNQGVNWTSDNPTVATVNASGMVTALAVGNATITATSQDNPAQFDTATISVIHPYRYHRFDYLGNTLATATANFCNDLSTGTPKLNISIAQVLPVDNVYLVTGSPDISDGYYRVILNSNTSNSDADENVSGDLFTNEITPVCVTNGVPDAIDDSATVASNSNVVINVLGNDTDPNNDALTIFSFTTPNVGTVSQQGDDLRYFSDDSCTTATFEYTVDDGNGGQDTATVTITKTASATFSGGGSVSSSFPSTSGIIEVLCDDVTVVLGAFGGSGGTTTNINIDGMNYSVTAPANDSLSSLITVLAPGTYNYTLSGSFSGGGSGGSVSAVAN
ncbi:Ig-like domain-containing protein [Aggregatimonas sangjinii]|uniref:Ig-like domain-containing protein n=1 Tax=Aggregatimonas sangjinii TaxID=2583587 RepID=UPI001586424F|nr:Ig-like domain-containing protein [Aggregatimonas sangjinii]